MEETHEASQVQNTSVTSHGFPNDSAAPFKGVFFFFCTTPSSPTLSGGVQGTSGSQSKVIGMRRVDEIPKSIAINRAPPPSFESFRRRQPLFPSFYSFTSASRMKRSSFLYLFSRVVFSCIPPLH
ncbi:hypothetical protein CEXT_519671 [Caerostris extrusa]|uniref:Uncharacterized protein n=1 Tax=Caerostris extrusa TaxID=172846 RepID=A0AAV4RB41_CAEEX|nr:hypothetical protein CEXT_519671 [Caerostris extrusa]